MTVEACMQASRRRIDLEIVWWVFRGAVFHEVRLGIAVCDVFLIIVGCTEGKAVG